MVEWDEGEARDVCSVGAEGKYHLRYVSDLDYEELMRLKVRRGQVQH